MVQVDQMCGVVWREWNECTRDVGMPVVKIGVGVFKLSQGGNFQHAPRNIRNVSVRVGRGL
jgi:hypothetical protein